MSSYGTSEAEEEDIDVSGGSSSWDGESEHSKRSSTIGTKIHERRFSHSDALFNQIKSFYFDNNSTENECKSDCVMKQFEDCIIIVGSNEVEIKAIKLFLSLNSDYFRRLFGNNNFNQKRKIQLERKKIDINTTTANTKTIETRKKRAREKEMNKNEKTKTNDIDNMDDIDDIAPPPAKKRKLTTNKSSVNIKVTCDPACDVKGLDEDDDDSDNSNSNSNSNENGGCTLSVYYEPDIQAETFDFIKKYCYGMYNQLSINENNVCSILYASEKYFLTELRKECTNFISCNTTVDNVIELLFKIPKLHDIELHFKNAISRISWKDNNNGKKLIDSIPLAQNEMPIDLFINLFLDNDNFNIKEEYLYEACVKYCKMNTENKNKTNNTKTKNKNNKNNNKNKNKNSKKNKTNKITTWQEMMRKYFVKYIRFAIMNKDYFLRLFNNNETKDEKLLSYKDISQILILFDKNLSTKHCGDKILENSEYININTCSRKRTSLTDEQLKILSNGNKYSNKESLIRYKLKLSSTSRNSSYSNTCQALLNRNDFMDGAATWMQNRRYSWIEFDFDGLYYISTIKIAPLHSEAPDGLSPFNLCGCTMQYFNQQTQRWVNTFQINMQDWYAPESVRVYQYDLKESPSGNTNVVIAKKLRLISPSVDKSVGISSFFVYGSRVDA